MKEIWKLMGEHNNIIIIIIFCCGASSIIDPCASHASYKLKRKPTASTSLACFLAFCLACKLENKVISFSFLHRIQKSKILEHCTVEKNK